MHAARLWLCLLAFLLYLPMPSAGASDAEWRDVLRAADYDPVHAIDDAERAAQQARERGDKATEARALLRVLMAEDVATLSWSEGYAPRGIALAREAGDWETLCMLLNFHSDYAEALALADRYHLDTCRAWTYTFQGEISVGPGHAAEAMDKLSKAYALFEALGDRYGMAESLRQMAGVFSGSDAPDRFKKVLDYSERAFAMVDPAHDRMQAAYYHYRVGTVYDKLKDQARARTHLESSIALFRAAGVQQPAARTKAYLAQIALEEKRYRDVLALTDRATLDTLEDMVGEDAHWWALLVRAEALAQLGQREASQKALVEGQASFALHHQTRRIPDYHRQLANIHAALGQYTEAYNDMRDFHEAQARITSEQNAKLAAEISARFDDRLKDAENARLRALEHEAQANRRVLLLALVLTLLLSTGLALWLRRRAAHQAALARAEASANAAKSDFLANMSHELRSPLNAILGFARLAVRAPAVPDEMRADLGIIVRSGEHLYNLINQVLDLSKIEAGRMALHETACDLAVVIDEIDELFGLAVSQKGLTLTIDTGPTALPPLMLDAAKLRQVLINLIGNAIKFTQDGGITLRMHTMGGDGESLRLSVAVIDTGPGIAAHELAGLGQAFVQAQAGRANREGTGLGLAICRAYVKIMGGELKLSSTPGQGTTVAFVIPVTAAPAEAVPDGRERQALGLEPGQPVYRILAVDDREEGRQLLVRLLTPLGFEVREAADGQQAIEQWRAWRPQLIFMDMRMPVMDGREATRRIKAEAQEPVVIVALTASSFESERRDILAAGCDDFLRKPFREPELFAVLEHRLGVRFVYEHAGDDSAAVAAAGTGAGLAGLPDLPVSVREALKSALERLDMAAVTDAIEAIRRHDPSVAAALAPMVADFQYGKILALLGRVASDTAAASRPPS
jgi:signal transduction histidine kinase/CheY-like chemotaxis protein